MGGRKEEEEKKDLAANMMKVLSSGGFPDSRFIHEKEGWPCNRESLSEFNRQSRTFQHSLSMISSLGI